MSAQQKRRYYVGKTFSFLSLLYNRKDIRCRVNFVLIIISADETNDWNGVCWVLLNWMTIMLISFISSL